MFGFDTYKTETGKFKHESENINLLYLKNQHKYVLHVST
jgi:hypothetical protein